MERPHTRRTSPSPASEPKLPSIHSRRLNEYTLYRIAESIELCGIEGPSRLAQRGMLHVGDCFVAAHQNTFKVEKVWVLADAHTLGSTARRNDGDTISRSKSVNPKSWLKTPNGLGNISPKQQSLYIVEGEKDTAAIMHGVDLAAGKTATEVHSMLRESLEFTTYKHSPVTRILTSALYNSTKVFHPY